MKFLITVLTTFLKTMVGALLSPIDHLLATQVPEIADAIAQVGSLFSWAGNFVNWVLSWIPLNTSIFNFLIAIWVFKLTIPLGVEAVKTIVKWWHALAP